MDSEGLETNRFLKVTCASTEERHIILENSLELTRSREYIFVDISLTDRIKRRLTETEINEHRLNDEESYMPKGFYIVNTRRKTVSKPLWMVREGISQK